jgi:hypothetical protein
MNRGLLLLTLKLHAACCDVAMRHRMAQFKIAEQQLL